jgi:segregation and condensation protein B
VNQPAWDAMAVLSALLFASDRPLSVDELAELIERVEGISPDAAEVRDGVRAVGAALDTARFGVELVEVAGGWELRTRAGLGPYVAELVRRKPQKLSRAALEVLSIVAYRQPCTRAAVDAIRGVDSSSVVRTLLERELIRSLGRSEEPGRPVVYGTTRTFLELFGLDSLTRLPALREITELTEELRAELDPLPHDPTAPATTDHD